MGKRDRSRGACKDAKRRKVETEGAVAEPSETIVAGETEDVVMQTTEVSELVSKPNKGDVKPITLRHYEAKSKKFETTEITDLEKWTSFEHDGFNEHVKFFLQKYLKRNFTAPSLIQSIIWPLLLNDESPRNIITIAPPASGKTFGYLVPAINASILNRQRGKEQVGATARVVILVPARELVSQLKKLLDQLFPTIRSAIIVGGNSKKTQIKAIENSRPDIIIATPGRLNDLVTTDISKDDEGENQAPFEESDKASTETMIAEETKNAEHTDGDTKKKKKKDDESAAKDDGKTNLDDKSKAEGKEKMTIRADFLSNIETIIVDEADRMADPGMEPQVAKLFRYVGDVSVAGSVRKYFSTASWCDQAEKAVGKLLKGSEAYFVDIRGAAGASIQNATSSSGENVTTKGADGADIKRGSEVSASKINQTFEFFDIDTKGFTDSESKVKKLIQILHKHPEERILIFCNMKKTVDWLKKQICEKYAQFAPPGEEEVRGKKEGGNATNADATKNKKWRLKPIYQQLGIIHADCPQEKRFRTFLDFKKNKLRVLIATDVLGRGVDIYGLNLVLNFDAPEKGENYLHRVGRVGRRAPDAKEETIAEPDLAPTSITFLGDHDEDNLVSIVELQKYREIHPLISAEQLKNEESCKKLVQNMSDMEAAYVVQQQGGNKKQLGKKQRDKAKKWKEDREGGSAAASVPTVENTESAKAETENKPTGNDEAAASQGGAAMSASARRRGRRKKAAAKVAEGVTDAVREVS